MVDIYKGWIRLRHRRLPDRHDEARQQRVLAEVRAGDPARGDVGGNDDFFMFGEVSDDNAGRSCRTSRRDDQAAGGAGLRVPAAAACDFAANGEPTTMLAGPVRRGRLVHRRRLERLQAADVPRQPRHGPRRRCSCATRTRARARPSCCARRARARADVLLARQPGRLLRRRAGLHRRRRRPGRPAGHVRGQVDRSTTTDDRS